MEIVMTELWIVVNEALVLLVVALIALVAWQVRRMLMQKLDAGQLQILNWVASMAVQAAEQYGGQAEEKKRQAALVAQSWLNDHGIFIDLNTLDAAIEAAVFGELNKPLPTNTTINVDRGTE